MLQKSVTRLLLLVACLLGLHAPALLAQVTISGRVTTPTGAPLSGLPVFITGSVQATVYTNSAGFYSATVPSGGDYGVNFYGDGNPYNGVDSTDAEILEEYILGVAPITEYQKLAGDINRSGTLTTFDVFSINNLAGGLPVPPGFVSWRFLPANFVLGFSAGTYPPLPEYDNLVADVTVEDYFAIKIGDLNGNAILDGVNLGGNGFFASRIVGQVRLDLGGDCVADAAPLGLLSNWVVRAAGPAGAYYATTDTTGAFVLPVVSGSYSVELLPRSGIWSVCTPPALVELTDIEVETLDFNASSTANCPVMTVELSTAFLRRCFDSSYKVFYCNDGTAPVQDAYVDVLFDPLLSVVSATIPWTSATGNSYRFPVGDMESGECGQFSVTVAVSCDAELGQVHCSTAHIYPDSICGPVSPLWSRADLEVEGRCEEGEAVFTIRNVGDDMTEPSSYVIIEDIMIQMTGETFQLDAGETREVSLPGNGSSWRIEVDQVPFHPYGAQVNANLEGCRSTQGGPFSMGFVTQFPGNDGRLFVDRDCQPNIGAFDPNDKQGFPTGVSEQHFIPKGTEIEYRIRFQNTGTDTAFNVVILDTLAAELLDMGSLRFLGSSHPCAFKLLGPGIAQFRFDNIMLPDSNVNEPASHGYAKFLVRPKADLPNLQAIENQAAIYFDFNEPIITNRTLHTIGELYLSAADLSARPGLALAVYPNPAQGVATFALKSAVPISGRLMLYDAQGRLVLSRYFEQNQLLLDLSQLSAGAYYFQMLDAQGAVGSGKLLVSGH
jgi:uncharacterized repeat protein (TIGR01451 family)